MADNIDITPGTGKTVSTDEVTIDGAAAHVQRVKVVHGTAGNGVDASSSDPLPVSLASVPSHAVTNAGTFAVQADPGTASNWAIRADDSAFTAGTSRIMVGGGVYDDSSPDSVDEGDAGAVRMSANRNMYTTIRDAAGNERGLNVDANGEVGVSAIRSALPAGTNAIGKLAANSGVDIGDVTLTAGTAAIGTLLPPDVDVTTHTNYAKKYYTNAGAVTDGIVWSPAAGKRWHVVSMFINVSAAATITLEDDKAGGDEAVMKMELAANSGTVVNFGEKYPLASGEDAADLLVTTSAGNVYITVTGYEI